MAERRGGALLILGALVMLGVTGAIVYWATQRDRKSQMMVFHWVPAMGELKVLGSRPDQDIAATLDPRLLDVLRGSGMGGELRFVATVPIPAVYKPHVGALLLQNVPTGPISLKMAPKGATLCVEDMPGLIGTYEKLYNAGLGIELTPNNPFTGFNFKMTGATLSSTGWAAASWW